MTEENDFPEDPSELTPEQLAELKIEFAPGCFDNFTGTQEELDELIAEIKEMVASGRIFEESHKLDMDELIEEDPEFAQALMDRLEGQEDFQRRLN